MENCGIDVWEMNVIVIIGWCIDNLLSVIIDKNLDCENYNLVFLLIGVND